MNPFLDKLKRGLDCCGLKGSRVLVGVSGGADSVALLRGLFELQSELNLELAAAHLNHQLRGRQSDEDAAWVESQCGQLDVPLILESNDIAGTAKKRGRGLEETARQLRYEFLTAAARSENCAHVAVAHTADDQAETILHHLLRGTGLAGLAGMPAQRALDEGVRLVRPLLEVSRGEVEAYLAHIGQEFRSDQSNEEPAFTRNRIRHALLPLLKREFNPQVERALLRLGRQAGDVQRAIEQFAERLLNRSLVDCNLSACRLNCGVLTAEPMHVVRECLLLLWKRQDWPRRQMGFDDWQRLAELVRGQDDIPGFTLPGRVEASRRGGLIVLRRDVQAP